METDADSESATHREEDRIIAFGPEIPIGRYSVRVEINLTQRELHILTRGG